jgi:hypothetical protein
VIAGFIQKFGYIKRIEPLITGFIQAVLNKMEITSN